MDKIRTMAQIGFFANIDQAEGLILRVLVPVASMNATKPEKVDRLKNISKELAKIFNDLRKIIEETLY